MGKPIAGQHQFPYGLTGFLVDGANINGVRYAKKLYIYKQRSYNTYDLMDEDGTIFRFIRIGYHDIDGNRLNYFDISQELADKIPINTFFMKIQDPSRGIFSFVRIYQYHKCITVDGDYVFRTADIDPYISGIVMNPSISTIQVGNTLEYKVDFFPKSYPANINGKWYLNEFGSLDKTDKAEIISKNKNTAVVRGKKEGRAILSFVPNANDTLVAHSIINVQPVEASALETFNIFTDNPNSQTLKVGDTFNLTVATFPYDAIILEPITITVFNQNPSGSENVKFTVDKVSDDNKVYTIKTAYIDESIDHDDFLGSYAAKCVMTEPFSYELIVYGINMMSEKQYTVFVDSQMPVWFLMPQYLRPNMTYKSTMVLSPDNHSEIFPYTSSDEDIATMDSSTGIITTHNKKGVVEFYTKQKKSDGTIVNLPSPVNTLTVIDEVYDRVDMKPDNITHMELGESIQFKSTGYRDGYDPVTFEMNNSDSPKVYTVSDDGTVTISSESENVGLNVMVSPNMSNPPMLYILDTYSYAGTSFMITNKDQIIPMVSIMADTNVQYIPVTQVVALQCACSPQPREATDYPIKVESYDNTIIDIGNIDALMSSQYALGGVFTPFIKPLKKGSTELVLSSVSNPEIKVKIKIVVY